MSKQSIKSEVEDYLINCGQNVSGWDVDAIVEKIDEMGCNSINDLEYDHFIDIMEENEVNNSASTETKTSAKIVAKYGSESIQFNVSKRGGKTVAECDFGDPYESDSIGGIVNAMISDGAVDVIVFDAN